MTALALVSGSGRLGEPETTMRVPRLDNAFAA